jgi:hypothetical protein
MDVFPNDASPTKRRKVAIQMAEAVMFLATIALRSGMRTVYAKLVAIHVELLELGTYRDTKTRRTKNLPAENR